MLWKSYFQGILSQTDFFHTLTEKFRMRLFSDKKERGQWRQRFVSETVEEREGQENLTRNIPQKLRI